MHHCLGRDINLEILRVEGYRKFCNKVWNATKFGLFRMDMVNLEGVRQQSKFVPNASPLVSLPSLLSVPRPDILDQTWLS